MPAAEFAGDGIRGDIAVTGGALDAIERVLQTELRLGDRVVVEDPSWPRIADLVHALGLAIEPVPVDAARARPDALERALRARRQGSDRNAARPEPDRRRGRPRARAQRCARVLAGHPDVLVIEDDYVAGVAGAPYVPAAPPEGRWAVVRSLSKVLGPDLRIALVAGDPLTIARSRAASDSGPAGSATSSSRLAALLLRDQTTRRLLARAERIYASAAQRSSPRSPRAASPPRATPASASGCRSQTRRPQYGSCSAKAGP